MSDSGLEDIASNSIEGDLSAYTDEELAVMSCGNQVELGRLHAERLCAQAAIAKQAALAAGDAGAAGPIDPGAANVHDPDAAIEALAVSDQDRVRAQEAYHGIFASGANGFSDAVVKRMLLDAPSNLALLKAAGSAWTFGWDHERVARIVATLSADTTAIAVPAAPLDAEGGGLWQVLDQDTSIAVLEACARSLLFVATPPYASVPAYSLPHSGQRVKLGELRSSVDFGNHFYSENPETHEAALHLRDRAIFEDITSHRYVDDVVSEFDKRKITEVSLQLCRDRLAYAYRLYRTMHPTAPPVDFTDVDSTRLFVSKIVNDRNTVGVRVCIATIVEQQRALTTLRCVNKEWRDFFRKHIFLPHVDPLSDMGSPDELEGYTERLPFANQRSNQRVGFCMRRVGYDDRFEYLPSTLVWNLAKSITVGTDTRTPQGTWQRLGPGGVEMTNMFVSASRRFRSFDCATDKLMPVNGYRVSAEHGSRPRFTLSYKSNPWFNLHHTNPHALVTLMHYRTGTVELCSKNTVYRPQWTTYRSPNPMVRMVDPLEHVALDISIPFNFLKTGGQQVAGKSKAAPMRVRLDFELNGGTVLHCAQEDPFYILWCNLTKQRRVHLKRSRSTATDGAQ
jgi:hypothetical protein